MIVTVFCHRAVESELAQCKSWSLKTVKGVASWPEIACMPCRLHLYLIFAFAHGFLLFTFEALRVFS